MDKILLNLSVKILCCKWLSWPPLACMTCYDMHLPSWLYLMGEVSSRHVYRMESGQVAKLHWFLHNFAGTSPMKVCLHMMLFCWVAS